MTDLDKAREWADRWSEDDPLILADAKAAIKLIKGLPDQWVDVEKVREIIEEMNLPQNRPSATPGLDRGVAIATEAWKRRLEALITPKLPTLADMTQEERKACQWMQCIISDDADDYCLLITVDTPCSRVIFQDGNSTIWNNDLITPLPDLPKLEWPGGTPDDVAYATGGVLTTQDVVDECRAVRKERALPRPEDVPDPHPGEAWLVNTREGEQREALKAGNRWYVKDGDDVEEWVEEALTPISRLVPELPALPEDERIESWHEIASHKFFSDCYRDGALIDHMIKKLDEVVDAEIVEEPENVDTPPAEKVTLSGMWVDDGSSPLDALKLLVDKYEELDRLNPEDVPPNEPWLIEVGGQKAIGTRDEDDAVVPWSVAALDGSFVVEYHDSVVTLIHKLVPEPPTLPEGMRLADHEEYGRIIVSPGTDQEDDYLVFHSEKDVLYGASWGYLHDHEFTYVDGDH